MEVVRRAEELSHSLSLAHLFPTPTCLFRLTNGQTIESPFDSFTMRCPIPPTTMHEECSEVDSLHISFANTLVQVSGCLTLCREPLGISEVMPRLIYAQDECYLSITLSRPVNDSIICDIGVLESTPAIKIS